MPSYADRATPGGTLKNRREGQGFGVLISEWEDRAEHKDVFADARQSTDPVRFPNVSDQFRFLPLRRFGCAHRRCELCRLRDSPQLDRRAREIGSVGWLAGSKIRKTGSMPTSGGSVDQQWTFLTAVDLTAARKGSSNSETSCSANAGYGSRRSVSYSRPIFMTSRDFDFETATWDCHFSKSMKSLLSPVDIGSKEGCFETIHCVPFRRVSR
jgi:hypothetical protein